MDDACKSLNDSSWGINHLTLHGLWPKFAKTEDGNDWPQNCWQSESTKSEALDIRMRV